jgi:hypothetical protein
MKKTTIYGLPLNPMPKLNELAGASFCVSYGTRDKLGKQLDQAIELVGEQGVLLVDNGAFSAFQAGINTMTDAAYLNGYADWANDILDRCPQAIAVLPDVIGGSWQDNAALVTKTSHWFPFDRAMPIWHLDEPLEYLAWLLREGYGYIGFGSSGEFFNTDSPAWTARIEQALALVDQLVEDEDILRPRIHMMRAQKHAHRFDFDSSDSTNVAVNHNRQLAKRGENLVAFAGRIDTKIQASAGPEAYHQLRRPWLAHVAAEAAERAFAWEMALELAKRSNAPAASPSPPELLLAA